MIATLCRMNSGVRVPSTVKKRSFHLRALSLPYRVWVEESSLFEIREYLDGDTGSILCEMKAVPGSLRNSRQAVA